MQINSSSNVGASLLPESGLLKTYIDEFESSLSGLNYSSGLTGSGYPLEISFTNRSEQPRYTIDPFCWKLPAEKRLQSTLNLIDRDFQIFVSPKQLCWITQLQARTPLYGAWLGLREKLGSISPKLYIEVDSSSEQKHWPELSERAPYDRCLTMIGYTPSLDNQESDDYELYYRSRNINATIFRSLLAPISASGHVNKFHSAIENICGRNIEDRLPGGTTGFSYQIDSTGEAKSLTLFIFCRSLFGRDKRTRRRFQALITSQGLCPDAYLATTDLSLTNLSANTQHGMLGVTISSQGEITYSVGYCPIGRQDNDR